jgi:hypothetical protein
LKVVRKAKPLEEKFEVVLQRHNYKIREKKISNEKQFSNAEHTLKLCTPAIDERALFS